MNRARMAARAAANPSITGRHSEVSLLAPSRVAPNPGPVRNRAAVRMTGAQRNSIGRRSEWSRSPYAPRGGWR